VAAAAAGRRRASAALRGGGVAAARQAPGRRDDHRNFSYQPGNEAKKMKRMKQREIINLSREPGSGRREAYIK